MEPAFVESFVYGTVAIFGLIWGSYLNVVVYRLPQGLSTAVPASHCPRCRSRIWPVDNIPVLSWLLLAARCRSCGGAISVRYPLVEVSGATVFVLGLRRFDDPFEMATGWLVACVLLALALIDYDRRLVPLVLTLPLGVLAWVLQPFLGWASPLDAVATSCLGSVVFLALSRAWGWWSQSPGDGGLGLGDAYVMFLIGGFFGLQSTLRIVLLALLGAVAVLFLSRSASWILRRSGRFEEPLARLPLVTFLSGAALWVLLFV
ncbi:MAG: prepilin peptidase [Thermoanaerobaculia bacterium]|nr:prepilin peptidase [Thermoanaerobaculia bacterium]